MKPSCDHGDAVWCANCKPAEVPWDRRITIKQAGDAATRTFASGATRDQDVSKLDYEGFLSPLVLKRFAEYMHSNRKLADGSLRDGDNWQKGIPRKAYMQSGWRHFFDWWAEHRGIRTREGIELALCGLLFNAMGYLHEHLKEREAARPLNPINQRDEE